MGRRLGSVHPLAPGAGGGVRVPFALIPGLGFVRQGLGQSRRVRAGGDRAVFPGPPVHAGQGWAGGGDNRAAATQCLEGSEMGGLVSGTAY